MAKPKALHLDMRVSEDDVARLRDLAEAEECSASEVVRRLVRKAHARLVAKQPKAKGKSK